MVVGALITEWLDLTGQKQIKHPLTECGNGLRGEFLGKRKQKEKEREREQSSKSYVHDVTGLQTRECTQHKRKNTKI